MVILSNNTSHCSQVLCLIAALTALSDGFFIKKKLKKLLLAKALIKGPILAIGAASAGKALKAKAALPAGVALGAGATALLGQSSGSSSATPKPVPSYYPSIAPAVVAPPGGYAYPSYPSASAAPAHSGSYTYSSTAAPAHEDGYNYPAPGVQDPAPPASNYGAQSWGASAPAAHSVQYYEQPQAVGYSSVSGSPHNSNNYGPIGGSLGSNNYQQPAW